MSFVYVNLLTSILSILFSLFSFQCQLLLYALANAAILNCALSILFFFHSSILMVTRFVFLQVIQRERFILCFATLCLAMDLLVPGVYAHISLCVRWCVRFYAWLRVSHNNV